MSSRSTTSSISCYRRRQVHLVRVVGRVGEGFDAHPAGHVRQGLLAALASQQDPAALEIFHRPHLRLILGVEVVLVAHHAVDEEIEPAAPPLHERCLELRVRVEHAVIDERHEGDHQRDGMMEDVRTREVRERVHSHAKVGAAVNSYGHSRGARPPRTPASSSGGPGGAAVPWTAACRRRSRACPPRAGALSPPRARPAWAGAPPATTGRSPWRTSRGCSRCRPDRLPPRSGVSG